MRRALFVFLALGGSAAAESWPTREGDTPLGPDRIAALTAGRTLTFYDDGRSKYSVGGSYSYTYGPQNGGGTAYGLFEAREDGLVCVRFRNGFDRCDRYVENAGRLVLITEDGARFPVRPD